jgi:hypothetical protein
MTSTMRVVKRSGEMEEYDPQKAMNAILRVGLSPEEAEEVMEEVRPHLYDGMTTEELYRLIRSRLPSCKATRYSLKKAIMLLGPDGHPFETLVGRVFTELGYTVELRQMLEGHCTTHEVDLVVCKNGVKGMVECKFHNALGIKTSIKDALYTWGRFLDIRGLNGISVPWLVTNTKFSSDVVNYARCVGMRTICWKCAEEKGLEKLVERVNIYPVTILDLKRKEQRILLDHDIIICRDILDRKEEMFSLFPRDTAEHIIGEAVEFLECVRK